VTDKSRAIVVRENASSWGQTNSAASAASVVVAQPLPVVGVLPAITGSATRMSNLQATGGTWGNDPTSFSYAWLRCDAAGANCTPIAGATRINYVLVSADVGHTITVAVTAMNTEGTTVAGAPPTALIAPVIPELVTTGTITGPMQVPQTIQVIRSIWHTTSETRYTYQWQRCDAQAANCADITGAKAQAYRLTTADARARLRVVNTATNTDGAVSSTTAATVAIKPALPVLGTSPRLTVAGRADVGNDLTLTPGVWNAATEITAKVLEFWRCSPRCTSLSTGGAGSYTLVDADAGAMMRGSETATGPGGTTVAWASVWLGPVRSASSGFASLSALSSATIRTSDGTVLAQASAGTAKAAAVASAATSSASPARTRTVRVSLRRAQRAPTGGLRAWVCLANPRAGDPSPCSKAVSLGSRATLKLAVAKGQRVRVVVVRVRKP
jgi:hypothetical protein